MSDKLVELLQNLSKATSEGRVRWDETGREGRYRIRLGQADLEIERESYEPSLLEKISSTKIMHGPQKPSTTEYRYVVYIRRVGGDKPLDVEFFDTGDEHYDLATGLYTSARRNATKFDQLLDSMIANVQQTG